MATYFPPGAAPEGFQLVPAPPGGGGRLPHSAGEDIEGS